MSNVSNCVNKQFLLINGIGNPAPKYLNTRHSIGNMAASMLRKYYKMPKFTSNGKNLVSSSLKDQLRITESKTLMNVSGEAVKEAINDLQKDLLLLNTDKDKSISDLYSFIVLHDELELPPGFIKLRSSGSLKGHNGLKSIYKKIGGQDFLRLGIGIGRPESRLSEVVSKFVLGKFNEEELHTIETTAYPKLIKIIEELRQGIINNGKY